MKKILTMVLAVALSVGNMVSCGNTETNVSESSAEVTTKAGTEEVSAEEAEDETNSLDESDSSLESYDSENLESVNDSDASNEAVEHDWLIVPVGGCAFFDHYFIQDATNSGESVSHDRLCIAYYGVCENCGHTQDNTDITLYTIDEENPKEYIYDSFSCEECHKFSDITMKISDMAKT